MKFFISLGWDRSKILRNSIFSVRQEELRVENIESEDLV